MNSEEKVELKREDVKYPVPGCTLKDKVRFHKSKKAENEESWSSDIQSVSDDTDSVSSDFPPSSAKEETVIRKTERKTALSFIGGRKGQKGTFQSLDCGGDKLDYVKKLKQFVPPIYKNFPLEDSLVFALEKEMAADAFSKTDEKITFYEDWVKTPAAVKRNEELHALVPTVNKQVVDKFNLAVIEKMLGDAGFEGKNLLRYYIYGFPLVGIIDEPGVFDRKNRDKRKWLKRKILKLQKKNDNRLKRIFKRHDTLDVLNWEAVNREVEAGMLEPGQSLEALIQENTPHVSTRRFGLLQRGGSKYRPIDNCKKSGINKVTVVRTPVQLSRIDDLVNAIIYMAKLWIDAGNPIENLVITLEKEDHEMAYKQLAARDSHKKYLYVISKDPETGELFAFRPTSLVFGSIASVIDYNMCSLMTQNLSRQLFWLAILSYFDDFIRPTLLQNKKGILFKRINTLIGHKIHPKKGEYGAVVEFLGVIFDMSFTGKLVLCLSLQRIESITNSLVIALNDNALSATDAGTLAGKLTFAQSVCFGRYGRAKLKPIYSRQHAPSRVKKLNHELREALGWFQVALKQNFKKVIDLTKRVESIDIIPEDEIVRIISDAEGLGGLGAFMFVKKDGLEETFFMAENFCRMCDVILTSDDRVICFLEAIAPLLVLRVFKEQLRGKIVIFVIDNNSALGALQKGYSSRYPNSEVTREFWQICAEYVITPWFERVSSEDNVADDPSRNEFGTSETLKAKRFTVRISEKDVEIMKKTLSLQKKSRGEREKKKIQVS